MDNKLSMHFGTDKTKSVIFASTFQKKNIKKHNIKYGDIQNQKHSNSNVNYLGCLLDEKMSGEAMVLNVINKINSNLKFLHDINGFLTPALRHLLYNASTQPHFDYTCSVWYPNLTNKLKQRI